MKHGTLLLLACALWCAFPSCTGRDVDPETPDVTNPAAGGTDTPGDGTDPGTPGDTDPDTPGVTTPSGQLEVYTDSYGEKAYIPSGFRVSEEKGEQTIRTGLVIIGPDGSEFVWIPTRTTSLQQRNFGSYFSGGSSLSGYADETSLASYQEMTQSVATYGGFYMGRFEASVGGGSSLSDYYPASRRVSPEHPGRIWVQFSPQDATVACANLYRDNPSVRGFFPWGANWDTTLQWLIDSGAKTESEVTRDSSGWGNYSDNRFAPGASARYTGVYEQTKANNIYDLAGNNWEWTQERYSSSYVMRGGGSTLMGDGCPGSRYPAALRDPLPGNDHHPNVTFRVALYLI